MRFTGSLGVPNVNPYHIEPDVYCPADALGMSIQRHLDKSGVRPSYPRT